MNAGKERRQKNFRPAFDHFEQTLPLPLLIYTAMIFQTQVKAVTNQRTTTNPSATAAQRYLERAARDRLAREAQPAAGPAAAGPAPYDPLAAKDVGAVVDGLVVVVLLGTPFRDRGVMLPPSVAKTQEQILQALHDGAGSSQWTAVDVQTATIRVRFTSLPHSSTFKL
jgi:hypothetical protein